MAKYKTINDLTEEEEQGQQVKSDSSAQNGGTSAQKASNSAGSAAQGSTHQGSTQTGTQQTDAVTQAQTLLQQQMQNKPGAYNSRYGSQLEALTAQILGRDAFSYDVNADALYQQMVQQYADQGRMAMMDTMGQAQAMTGGYGNSYAQQAGQQAYQGYLRQATEMLPQYYQMALDQYNQQGQELYNQYGLLLGQEDTEYGRYQDALNNYYAELDRLQGIYDQERAFQYQQGRDQVADQQWAAQMAEEQRQFNHIHDIGSGKSSKKENVIQNQPQQPQPGDSQEDLPVEDDYTGDEFNGSTYGEAAAYLRANGASASGLMTQSEWQRHKNTGSSVDGEHEASSYQEYLDAYIFGKTGK